MAKNPELEAFLKTVEGRMWGMSSEDKAKAKEDIENYLKRNAAEFEKRTHADNAIELAISTLPSPEVIGAGCRRLYGYGLDIKMGLIAVVCLLALFTVPVYPLASMLTLPITFFIAVLSAREMGIWTAAGLGLGGALSRSVFAGMMYMMAPDSYDPGGQGLIYFAATSVLLIVATLIAGLVHEEDLRRAVNKATAKMDG